VFTQTTLAVVMLFGANDYVPEQQLIPVPQGQVIEMDDAQSVVVSSSTACPCRKGLRSRCRCKSNDCVPCLGGWWQWWISPCTMKQHNAYCPTLGGNYYFRPYNVAQLDRQHAAAEKMGLDGKNPYDTSFFQKDVYDRLPAEWFASPIIEEGEVVEEIVQEPAVTAAPIVSTPDVAIPGTPAAGGLMPVPAETPAEPGVPVFSP